MNTHFGLAEWKMHSYMVIMAVVLFAMRIATTNLSHGTDMTVACYCSTYTRYYSTTKNKWPRNRKERIHSPVNSKGSPSTMDPVLNGDME